MFLSIKLLVENVRAMHSQGVIGFRETLINELRYNSNFCLLDIYFCISKNRILIIFYINIVKMMFKFIINLKKIVYFVNLQSLSTKIGRRILTRKEEIRKRSQRQRELGRVIDIEKERGGKVRRKIERERETGVNSSPSDRTEARVLRIKPRVPRSFDAVTRGVIGNVERFAFQNLLTRKRW